MDDTHRQSVAKIAEQARSFYQAKRPFYIFHGSTNSTRILSFKRSEMIDVSALARVISVDVATQTAIVEPNVPMDALVEATLKYGLIPPVVMEFPGITVGGGIQGGAGESGSFRWGCFNRIFNWYELLLANGTLVRASPEDHADLFNGTAGSYGTLGIITAGEIKLIPARKYVELTYLPVTGFAHAVEILTAETTKDHDFIDGIMFGRDHGVIMVGRLTDTRAKPLHRFTRATDPWFYLHASSIDQSGQVYTEHIPLKDYLFRYDRGAFWVGRFGFARAGVAFNGFTRFLFNPLMHTRQLYQALQTSGVSQEHVVQDLALPKHKAVAFMEFVDKTLGIYPLWLCPLKPDPDSPLQSNNLDTPLVINVGVWGSRIKSYDEFLQVNRSIETKVQGLGGKKWFYAHSYYTETEFWDIYDKAWYVALRKKYHASNLPTVFDKISVRHRVTVSVRRGVLKTLFGLANLRIR
jgi:delta24-sterol reductase